MHCLGNIVPGPRELPVFNSYEDFKRFASLKQSDEEKEMADRLSNDQILRRMVREKVRLFSTSVDGRIYPNKVVFQKMIGDALDQNPEGTCYLCTGLNWLKFVVWLHTGKKIKITHEEMVDFAFDYKAKDWNATKRAENQKQRYSDRIIGGGTVEGVKSVFTYNSNLGNHLYGKTAHPLVTEFLKIAAKNGITESNITSGGGFACNKNAVVKAFADYGPMYWAHYPDYHPSYSRGEGSHAILIVGYDPGKIFLKGSWTDVESNDTYLHNFSLTDSEFGDMGIRVYPYTNLIWKNL